MHFHFNLANHTGRGRRSLQDVVGVLSAQLLDLGHSVSHIDGKSARAPAINVFVEGFVGDTAAKVAALRDEGKRYLILNTERPGHEGASPEVAAERARGMAICAPDADAIWTLDAAALPHCETLNPCVAAVELGYSPRTLRDTDPEPEFDFGFFGSTTVERLHAIWELKGRGYSVRVISADFNDPNGVIGAEARDREMQRCRVILCPEAHPGMPFSNSRGNTALNVRRPLVAQRHQGRTLWRYVAPFASPAAFADAAEMVLRDWRGEWRGQYALFQAVLPQQLLADAIARTLH